MPACLSTRLGPSFCNRGHAGVLNDQRPARANKHDLAGREPRGARGAGQEGREDHEHVAGAVDVAVPKFADAFFWAAESSGRPKARRG
jgi:hypothetical protein